MQTRIICVENQQFHDRCPLHGFRHRGIHVLAPAATAAATAAAPYHCTCSRTSPAIPFKSSITRLGVDLGFVSFLYRVPLGPVSVSIQLLTSSRLDFASAPSRSYLGLFSNLCWSGRTSSRSCLRPISSRSRLDFATVPSRS